MYTAPSCLRRRAGAPHFLVDEEILPAAFLACARARAQSPCCTRPHERAPRQRTRAGKGRGRTRLGAHLFLGGVRVRPPPLGELRLCQVLHLVLLLQGCRAHTGVSAPEPHKQGEAAAPASPDRLLRRAGPEIPGARESVRPSSDSSRSHTGAAEAARRSQHPSSLGGTHTLPRCALHTVLPSQHATQQRRRTIEAATEQ